MDTLYVYIDSDGEITGVSFTELEGTVPAKVSDRESFLEYYSIDSLRYDNGYLVPSLRKSNIRERQERIDAAYREYNESISKFTYGMYEFDPSIVNENSLVNDLTLIEKGLKKTTTLVDNNMLFLTLDETGLKDLLTSLIKHKEERMDKLQKDIAEAQ